MWTWLKKGNLKKETETLLIAAQNDAMRTNHIKAIIDKTQQNSRYRSCGNRDQTINHIIRECSKLARKEYKTKHDWVGKVIHWKSYKKFKFDHTNKSYRQNPKFEAYKLFLDFDIQIDHPLLARRSHLVIINKKKRTCRIVDFSVPVDHRIKAKKTNKQKQTKNKTKKQNKQKPRLVQIPCKGIE